MSNAASTPPTTKRPWLWMTLLFALLIALAGGILRSATGGGLADAILTGGKAFSATVTLCLTVIMAFRSR